MDVPHPHLNLSDNLFLAEFLKHGGQVLTLSVPVLRSYLSHKCSVEH